jgi:hypothetical protein
MNLVNERWPVESRSAALDDRRVGRRAAPEATAKSIVSLRSSASNVAAELSVAELRVDLRRSVRIAT